MTVLAYGQTGSGKTFSMGTCPTANQTDYGIIPRAIHDIFDVINNDDDWIFKVSVSFLEVRFILETFNLVASENFLLMLNDCSTQLN